MSSMVRLMSRWWVAAIARSPKGRLAIAAAYEPSLLYGSAAAATELANNEKISLSSSSSPRASTGYRCG